MASSSAGVNCAQIRRIAQIYGLQNKRSRCFIKFTASRRSSYRLAALYSLWGDWLEAMGHEHGELVTEMQFRSKEDKMGS